MLSPDSLFLKFVLSGVLIPAKLLNNEICDDLFVVVVGWHKNESTKAKKPAVSISKIKLTKFISGNNNCPKFTNNFRVAKFVIIQVSFK